jgi:protein gp37
MGATTGISWTDATWNPIRGCSRVSEGCRHCYAEMLAGRFSGPGQPYEGLAKKVGGEARWTGEVRFIEKHLEDPLRWRKPRRIFVNSMSDLFHERVADEWLDRIFVVMALAPHHTFQVLTKRPERMRAYLADQGRLEAIYAEWYDLSGAPAEAQEWPLPNVWLGVSVENQEAADERIPILLQTPAAIRFLSVEPMLSPVNLLNADEDGLRGGLLGALHWVICGGESGPGHRDMLLSWARSLRDQCTGHGVPFFFKQISDSRSGQPSGDPELDRCKEFPNA